MSAEFCIMTEIRSPIADRTLFASKLSLAATRELSFSSWSNHAISFFKTAVNIFSRTRLVKFSPTTSQKQCCNVLKTRAADETPINR
ncbi:hypothetical protein HanIR_Chr11g0553851 [Helianthus annuus]|nr:hypothetical protein HanIR_Chr11g0553851 [Helianthus annuus]